MRLTNEIDPSFYPHASVECAGAAWDSRPPHRGILRAVI